jgi:hypothetical protein
MIAGLAQAIVLGVGAPNLELIWGSLLTSQLGVGTWVLGLAIHLGVSGLIGSLYIAGFRAIRQGGWPTGLAFSGFHWIVMGGFFLGLLPYFHPLIPGEIPAPGYLGTNLGPSAFWSVLFSHLVFGWIVGALDRQTPQSHELFVQGHGHRHRPEQGQEAA